MKYNGCSSFLLSLLKSFLSTFLRDRKCSSYGKYIASFVAFLKKALNDVKIRVTVASTINRETAWVNLERKKCFK